MAGLDETNVQKKIKGYLSSSIDRGGERMTGYLFNSPQSLTVHLLTIHVACMPAVRSDTKFFWFSHIQHVSRMQELRKLAY